MSFFTQFYELCNNQNFEGLESLYFNKTSEFEDNFWEITFEPEEDNVLDILYPLVLKYPKVRNIGGDGVISPCYINALFSNGRSDLINLYITDFPKTVFDKNMLVNALFNWHLDAAQMIFDRYKINIDLKSVKDQIDFDAPGYILFHDVSRFCIEHCNIDINNLEWLSDYLNMVNHG